MKNKVSTLLKGLDQNFDIEKVEKSTIKNKYDIHFCFRNDYAGNKDSVDFDLLLKLSKLFQTKKINLGSESRDDGYCETCSNPYSVVVIRINEATI